ncbi:NAD(P)H-dependent FMN reductase [Lewinella aquimaris]|uniref:NAD(P)H-dependent FMN reductase n=1 Tax=Neolewinella aquimaris TaxID=1835722 RepID=A0A840E1B1_9BACT|nr:NADPH-dependent FMN reductase [Neolewinella aquimaris]MBB4077743.1 NAD(P)H-dependent FMN reductase [Neolewinella aquimaris]
MTTSGDTERFYLTVSGSPHPLSANSRLLASLAHLTEHALVSAGNIADLPVFQPDRDRSPWPATVTEWRDKWRQASSVILCTPAYLHTIPAVLKNALEWLTSSGEAAGKPVLLLTFTPAPPRGERAMRTLQWTLQALDARIVATMPLYQNEVGFTDGGDIADSAEREVLTEALNLLG